MTLGKLLQQITFEGSIIRMTLPKQINDEYIFRPFVYLVKVAHVHNLHHYHHLSPLQITNPLTVKIIFFPF